MTDESSLDLPQFQFRGIWLPAEIIEQFLEGSLNKTDLLLLIVIESLVENRGRGCFATNAYLAKATGSKNGVYISQCISKLVKAKLVKITNKTVNRKPARYLETSWSRSVQENSGYSPELKGGYSSQLYPYNEGVIKIKEEGASASLPPPSPPSITSSNTKPKPEIELEFLQGAERLHRCLIRRKIGIMGQYSQEEWAIEFRRLKKWIAKQKLKGVYWAKDLGVFCQLDRCGFEAREIKTFKFPEVHNAKQFCDLMRHGWMRDSCKKARKHYNKYIKTVG
jgi:hypothetical protein